MITRINTAKAGLNTADRGMPDDAQLRTALNVIPTGGSLRTTPGYFPIHDQVYRSGTDSKVALFANSFDEIDANSILVRATKQSKVTGSANATVANCLNVAAATFTPEHVGCYVQNTTDATTATITRFISNTRVKLSSDIFTSGENFSLHEIGDTIASAFYTNPNAAAYSDGALIGEIADTDDIKFLPVQDRLLVLTGEERGNVIHGDSFRPIGMSECFDNNSLAYTVTDAGNKTGLYKWALTFFDESTFRESPPLYIENSARDDGFFSLSANKLSFTEATLPTNTVDTWTHYKLYCKKAEWKMYKFVATMEKTASSLEDNSADNILVPRENLIENRYAPSGFTRGVNWLNRAILWRRYALSIDGNGSGAADTGVSVENGSKEVTLSNYTTAEWMAGSRIYMAADTGSLTKGFDIQYVKDANTLVLFSAWDGDSIAFGDARFVPEPNRLTICMKDYNTCEFTSPFHVYDINPNDGDEIVSCSVIGETLYVVKKRSLWAVRYVRIVDQVSHEIPTVLLDVKQVVGGDGCVGSQAITVGDDGSVYWLTADGLVNFDGRTVRQVSRTGDVDVSQYIQWQTTTDLADVTIAFNSAWKCVEIFGLKREDGTDASLRFFTKEGRWFESDAVPSNNIAEAVGMKPYVAPSPTSEWLYAPVQSGDPDEPTLIVRADLQDTSGATFSTFATLGLSSFGDPFLVKDMCPDRNGDLITLESPTGFLHGNGWGYAVTDNEDEVFVRKYSRADGSVTWSSENIIKYIRDIEIAAGYTDPGVRVHSAMIAISATTVCIAIQAYGIKYSPDTMVFHAYMIILDISDGTTTGYRSFETAPGNVYAWTTIDWDLTCGGVAYDPVNGDYWAAFAYRFQGVNNNATDLSIRLIRIDESSLGDNETNDITVDGDTSAMPLGCSYGVGGYLLIPVWHCATATITDGKMGLCVYDIGAGTTDTASSNAYDHFNTIPHNNHTGGDDCGIGRTGQRIGWSDQQLENGVAAGSLVAPTNVWLADGKRLWKCVVSPASIDPTAVTDTDYTLTGATRRSNGDLVDIRYYWTTPLDETGVNIKVTVRNCETGAEKFSFEQEVAAESTAYFVYHDASRSPSYGHIELPWCLATVSKPR